MIVSHEHKFIFLKTKKTAGTSIELALNALCGPDDVITPLTTIDEALREGKRGARNWRRHGWWGSAPPEYSRKAGNGVVAECPFLARSGLIRWAWDVSY
jgi:hypothetical protein